MQTRAIAQDPPAMVMPLIAPVPQGLSPAFRGEYRGTTFHEPFEKLQCVDPAAFGREAEGGHPRVAGDQDAQAIARGVDGGHGRPHDLQGPPQGAHGIAQEHGGRRIDDEP